MSGNEPNGLTAVAAADVAQQLTTIRRLVQAAVLVAIEVARQHAFATKLVDGCRAYTELFGHLFAGERAALAQPFEAAAQLIGAANDDDLLQRERLTAPISVPEFVEPGGYLLVAWRIGLCVLGRSLAAERASIAQSAACLWVPTSAGPRSGDQIAVGSAAISMRRDARMLPVATVG